MKTDTIDYQDGAVACRGWAIHGEAAGADRPGVMLAPDMRGLGPQSKARAERLAQLGFVVLVADLYGGARTPRDFADGMDLIKGLRSSTAGWRQRICAGLDALAGLPGVDRRRLAAIGFCFGGSTVLELAYSGADLAAVVSFHGALDGPQLHDAANIKARILVCNGADDRLVGDEQVTAFKQAMRNGRVADWQVVEYGNTKHGFTDPDSDKAGMPELAYSSEADSRSWASMRALFDACF
jgi:dienelactone hydrolase